MYFIRSTLVVIALFFTIGTIQSKPINSSSNNVKGYIKYLLNIIGIENEYTKFLSFMKVYPPEDIKMRSIYDELFSSDAYLHDLIDVYAKYYTLDDITKLIEFYSSPLGKKTLKFHQELDKQMEDTMLTKISDYIFTASEHGLLIPLPNLLQ